MLVPSVKPVTVVTVVPVVTDTPAVLVHVPPLVKLLSVIEEPLHTEARPPILEGSALTVTTAIVGTPPIVYDIVAVPGLTPVTIPDVPTVAIEIFDECQVPPDVALVKAVVEPAQTLSVPVTPVRPDALTVTTRVADTDPQLLVTV